MITLPKRSFIPRDWWTRRSLKLRLAACFTVVSGAVILVLIPAAYSLIEQRLHLEQDHQLRIDWALVEAHLEATEAGGIQWRSNSPATPSSAGYASTWFDVWSGKKMLLSHWPDDASQVLHPPRRGGKKAEIFYNIKLEENTPARSLQIETRVDGRRVILRVFRDESGIRSTLREILAGLVLGLPISILLAGAGGYLMAGKALQPLRAMADEAGKITSDSLGKRLPNPNPNDELGKLATVFNQTLERLELSFESLKRFTADASHELRTPLTALRSVGEIALRGDESEHELRETISSMLEEANRLNDLVSTMLMFARVEGGSANLDIKPLSIDQLCAEICESLDVLAVEKDQRLTISHEPNLIIESDALLLRHAVMNIVHNAINYSPRGAKIEVRCFKENFQAIIEITDDGPGIRAEHREKVFDRFYRVDPARSQSEGGSGLGLAIAKLSIEQICGSIELREAGAQGCCFRINLPLNRSES